MTKFFECFLGVLLVVGGSLAAPSQLQNTLDSRCWASGNGNEQPRWFDEGSEIIKETIGFTCDDGELKPTSCISPKGQKIPLGSTYDDNGFRFKCIPDTANAKLIRPEPSACLDERQQVRNPGEVWENTDPSSPYFYECKQSTLWDRPYLIVKTRGCLVKGKRLESGETMHMDENWVECQDHHDGTAILSIKGCYHNGKEIALGDNWEEEEYVYECRKMGDIASAVTCIGCMHGDRRLKSGDRYFKDDTVISCEILYYPGENKTSKNHKIVGCVEKARDGKTVGERNIGCQWNHDEGDNRYEYICNPQGKVNTVGCTIMKNGFEHIFVPVNSYTIYQDKNEPSTGAGCKEVDGQLQLFKFKPEELLIKAQGLKYQEPRGKK